MPYSMKASVMCVCVFVCVQCACACARVRVLGRVAALSPFKGKDRPIDVSTGGWGSVQPTCVFSATRALA